MIRVNILCILCRKIVKIARAMTQCRVLHRRKGIFCFLFLLFSLSLSLSLSSKARINRMIGVGCRQFQTRSFLSLSLYVPVSLSREKYLREWESFRNAILCMLFHFTFYAVAANFKYNSLFIYYYFIQANRFVHYKNMSWNKSITKMFKIQYCHKAIRHINYMKYL